MENWMFFWLSWILWVFFYFFDSNQNRRFLSASVVLIIMIPTNWYVQVSSLKIFLPVLIALLFGTILIAIAKRRVSFLVMTASLGFAYGGIQIWEHLNPLWLFLPTPIVWSIVGFISFIFISTTGYYDKVGILLVSTSLGQLLHGLVRQSYGFNTPIGSLSYLTDLCLPIPILTVIQALKTLSLKIEQSLQSNKMKSIK